MSIKENLSELRKALYDFSKRNTFVHVQPKSLWFPENEYGLKSPEKIIQKSNFYLKEYGLSTTLEVCLFIRWCPPQNKGKSDQSFFLSPLLYKPCKVVRNRKIETTYVVQTEEEFYTVNPILRHYFLIYFEVELPEKVENTEALVEFVQKAFSSDQENERLKLTHELDDKAEWQLIQITAVGNFNYKKSMLGADYDRIEDAPNDQVRELVGDKTEELKAIVDDSIKTIIQLDQSQRKVVGKSLQNGMVIQGPPGTGKSHTIVGLIGAFLNEGKKVLFVSEKRSALDVVYDRLKEKGLNELVAYFNTETGQKKAFYQRLKLNWEKLSLIEERQVEFINHKTDAFDLLDLYPMKMNAFNDKLSGSWQDMIAILLESNKTVDELKLSGKIPAYGEWSKFKSDLAKLEAQFCKAFEANTIAETIFVLLNQAVFNEAEVVEKLEKRLADLRRVLTKITALLNEYALDKSFDDFVKLALTGSVLNMVNNVQLDLLNKDAKQFKSFNNWSKKYQLLKVKLNQAEQANKGWTKKPSLSEITELMGLLSDLERRRKSKSVFSALRRNPAKLKTAFSDFHAGISDHTKIKLLESLKLEWRLKGELEEIKVKLKHNLNINDPDTEIDLIFNLRNKLDTVSQSEYLTILEHERVTDLIHDLSNIHPEIVQFNAQCRFLFTNYEIPSIQQFEEKVDELNKALPTINHWLPELKQFYAIPATVRKVIINNTLTVDDLNAGIAYTGLMKETRFEQSFKSLTGWDLLKKIEEKGKFAQIELTLNKEQILERARQSKLERETLLGKASYKLKGDDKKRKKDLKAQKRTILHEINKVQRHQPVRQFFESTGDFLMDLQPLWMMNPLTVSEYLPCVADLFDVVIFDESSQIPLEDALPSVYRSKQLVVVGDMEQMPPTAFFKSETDTPTILDAAAEVYPGEMLKWHYRSKHPDLIHFSNQEFYQGNLIALPPRITDKPIELIQTNGIYDSGRNPIEAMRIANYCKDLNLQGKNAVIIAFSQEQEKEIQKQLKAVGLTSKDWLSTRNLENAQGIEADIVVLSLGYGKDASGDFRLNFGPVNRASGANRLNVLFTRAIEKMVVFTSVEPADFGLSGNRGVQLIRDFLLWAQNPERDTNTFYNLSAGEKVVKKLLDDRKYSYSYYPATSGIALNCFIQHSSQKILLVDPGLNDGETHDIEAIISVLKAHFAQVKIILSVDLWLYSDRMQKEIGSFFVENEGYRITY